jgi:hypothetical protein
MKEETEEAEDGVNNAVLAVKKKMREFDEKKRGKLKSKRAEKKRTLRDLLRKPKDDDKFEHLKEKS